MSEKTLYRTSEELAKSMMAYVLAFEDVAKPVVSGLLDLILESETLNSTDVMLVADATADIAGWFSRCTTDLNQRYFALLDREDAGRLKGA